MGLKKKTLLGMNPMKVLFAIEYVLQGLANPFRLMLGGIPIDGSGLNPMLQDPAMIAHPPLLFIGYAGFTIPFAFFGHSLGSLISFELTRRLRRQKAPCPLQLFISGCRAPQVPNPDPPIHHLPDTEFIEELGRFNGTPQAVLDNPEDNTKEVLVTLARNYYQKRIENSASDSEETER